MSNQNKMARALKNLAYVTELGFLLVIPLVLLLFLANFLQSRFEMCIRDRNWGGISDSPGAARLLFGHRKTLGRGLHRRGFPPGR